MLNSFRINCICLCFILVCIAMLSYGCGCPPTQEIADAEVALSKAREAGAEIYALKEFKSAESKLEEARQELAKFRYRSSKALAIEAKDKALLAKELTETEKEKLRNEARETIRAAKDALTAAKIAGAEKYDPASYNEAYALIGESEMALSQEKFHIAIEKAKEAERKARRLELASKRASELEPEVKKEKEELTPFLKIPPRTEPEVIYDKHVVQKGECLWIISEYERIYGNPFMWPLIYKANRSQINDPDLIFPGQNLGIPRNNVKKDIENAIYNAKHRGPWSLYDGK